jgi:hypothetical protein
MGSNGGEPGLPCLASRLPGLCRSLRVPRYWPPRGALASHGLHVRRCPASRLRLPGLAGFGQGTGPQKTRIRAVSERMRVLGFGVSPKGCKLRILTAKAGHLWPPKARPRLAGGQGADETFFCLHPAASSPRLQPPGNRRAGPDEGGHQVAHRRRARAGLLPRLGGLGL